MHVISDAPNFTKIALKWHDLAERRLDYYTELYRSGRYKHYYTQERFALRMLEVIEAAKQWRVLAGLPREKRPEGEAAAKGQTTVGAASASAKVAEIKAADIKAASVKAGSSKADSVKAETSKMEAVKADGAKADSLKSDSRKSESPVRRAAGLRPAA